MELAWVLEKVVEKEMEKETWEKLAPHVLPFLPSDFLAAGENRSEWGRVRVPSARSIPLISAVQASGFDSTLESFDSYAASLEHGEAPLIANREGLIAIQISDDSFRSWFPAGTVVYVGGREYPVPGRRVIAKRKDSGEIVSDPDIINKGSILSDAQVAEAKNIVTKTINSFDVKSVGDIGEIRNTIRKNLRNFVIKKTKKSPMIIPVVTEV